MDLVNRLVLKSCTFAKKKGVGRSLPNWRNFASTICITQEKDRTRWELLQLEDGTRITNLKMFSS